MTDAHPDDRPARERDPPAAGGVSDRLDHEARLAEAAARAARTALALAGAARDPDAERGRGAGQSLKHATRGGDLRAADPLAEPPLRRAVAFRVAHYHGHEDDLPLVGAHLAPHGIATGALREDFGAA